MPRKLVKFKAGFGRYNAGETAAFDEATALKYTSGKNPVAEVVGDAEEPAQPGGDAKGRMAAESAALSAKANELAEREKALEQREAALEALAPAAVSEGEPAAPEEAVKVPGEPPKQGKK